MVLHSRSSLGRESGWELDGNAGYPFGLIVGIRSRTEASCEFVVILLRCRVMQESTVEARAGRRLAGLEDRRSGPRIVASFSC
ncbi:hypothetical protein QVD17_19509 [Tagetes erecta]|uniref:Uncharacterized protein n=1 Tax=Tagetes erecta TaxID=13708 RepID=A0AAD8NWJ6_TARER|nr:hypothetical protein QVD17_19509 [Tagetes erecta]